mmetsp:Transcript_59597/g.160636  ORF Transcript_59597/g.160636 Transcript_59597/m.160636 type:complete len:390 (-) Transcript_59597:553-1722(-)
MHEVRQDLALDARDRFLPPPLPQLDAFGTRMVLAILQLSTYALAPRPQDLDRLNLKHAEVRVPLLGRSGRPGRGRAEVDPAHTVALAGRGGPELHAEFRSHVLHEQIARVEGQHLDPLARRLLEAHLDHGAPRGEHAEVRTARVRGGEARPDLVWREADAHRLQRDGAHANVVLGHPQRQAGHGEALLHLRAPLLGQLGEGELAPARAVVGDLGEGAAQRLLGHWEHAARLGRPQRGQPQRKQAHQRHLADGGTGPQRPEHLAVLGLHVGGALEEHQHRVRRVARLGDHLARLVLGRREPHRQLGDELARGVCEEPVGLQNGNDLIADPQGALLGTGRVEVPPLVYDCLQGCTLRGKSPDRRHAGHAFDLQAVHAPRQRRAHSQRSGVR